MQSSDRLTGNPAESRDSRKTRTAPSGNRLKVVTALGADNRGLPCTSRVGEIAHQIVFIRKISCVDTSHPARAFP